ncbi:c-type cytochrome biogenesis protein CcmI [Caulobacter flavus]|uniref:C-type cytochrome biogenesis protein CcmI n=1 Tax=Caulobacter flavus TaxID=1679497 RepID=A0A2N5CS46_9CAUL|nr:c-type cytochrome biogenesis protein CcmI [Caulobacter flavus]AYV46507.1 c-type cytochrome biogenesis protein CcmI [Caulobacter flavus]PLR12804.1 c-type cytochrome biogenesis protein CcmI [Caulobacter flavus]
MIGFWIAAAGLSAAVAALVLRGAARGLTPAGDDPALAVHRRQLSEIDDLAERGLLAEGELKAARAEAGRRLLAAADQSAAWPREGLGPRRVTVIAAAAAPLLALGLYVVVGAPGAPDQPFARRVAEWKAGDASLLDPPRIVAILEQAARTETDNPELYRNLAIARMAGGDAIGAAEALRKAVRLAPQRAELWTALGEAFVTSEEGQVGADARTAFTEALKRDPENLSARYHLAKGEIADGRLEAGLAGWRAVLADLPADDPRRPVLAAEIDRTAQAGRLVDAVPQQAAAGEVTPDMIQGMVEGLAQRLAAAPDDPEGWVRLVRAYAVLGDAARRDAALKAASERFADQPRVLAALRQAADTPPAQTLNVPKSNAR